jgi:uncharacterized protein YbjT (DUF2867 family)
MSFDGHRASEGVNYGAALTSGLTQLMAERSENTIAGQPDWFCQDLPTEPLPQTGKLLVTGGSGYVGGRLVPELQRRGYKVRVMVRGDADSAHSLFPGTEIMEADALNLEQLRTALRGIDTAFYLIHSLYLGPKEFEAADIEAARNFRKVAEEEDLRRIIYLGGLGDVRVALSSHLRNRIEVAEELSRGSVPVTILRAAIIIGSGSASYEIIQYLVRRLPVIIIPHWARNRCQPISIRDVIKYLVGVLETPETIDQYYDIGGGDVLSYTDMLRNLSSILNRNTIIIHIPISMMSLYAYVVSLLTPVPNTIVRCLITGLKNEVICQDDSIKRLLPFEPIPYREAIVRAMTREEQDRVYTRWSDAYPPAHELALKLRELGGKTAYSAEYSLLTFKDSNSLFRSICKVGGKEGWFHGNWMWRLRGAVDRILLGVGSSRGRKRRSRVEVNDVIDFWRIEDVRFNRRLLLRSEMKLPGKAWLEFNISEESGVRRLTVRAFYDTHTLFGKIYWYIFLPFHYFIFRYLIEAIERRS